MKKQFSSPPTKKFEFLLLNGFSNMVLASALEPLRDVRMRAAKARLDWDVTTLDGQNVASSSGSSLTPDRRFDPSTQRDVLVIVAGYSVRDQVSRELDARIRQAARHSPHILALDTASWVLAKAGLLDGHRATIHWQERDAFAEAFPNVQVQGARFVRSGPFTTCGGASAVLEMMLHVIQEKFGAAAAFDASNMFVYDPARQKDTSADAGKLRGKGSAKLLAALDILAQTVEQPLSTFQLAERLSLSERSLNRMFTRELGMTPGKYAKLYRLKHAQYLAQETRLSREQIALRCGFSCASALSRSFLHEFGTPLSGFRA